MNVPTASCIGANIDLSASGTTAGIGIDYQWQSSSSSVGPWSDIAAANTVLATVPHSVGTYYRLRTVCTFANDTAYSNVQFIDAVNCYSMGTVSTVNGCSGIIFDTGGQNGSYSNNEDLTMVITPTPGNFVTLTFTEFGVEEDYDELYIYDGSSITANLIDVFSGPYAPTTIVSTNGSGAITLNFISDYSTTYSGFAAIIGCLPKPAEDMVIVSIDSPKQSSCTFGNEIELTVLNAGTDTLVTAEFIINSGGLTQNVSWTGSIAPTQSQQITLNGPFYFNDGDSLNILATLPNGVVDPTPANNVKGVRHYIALQGVYKIGYGVTNSDTIATIQLAIDRLHQRGICSDVFFDIEPGTYSGAYVINQYFGWNSGMKVIFRSETQNVNDVTIQSTATSSSNNYVFRLNGADGIGFQYVTFTSSGNTYNNIIDILNGAHEFMADNCTFIGDTSSATLTNNDALTLIKSSTNTVDHASVITNNTFIGASRAIYLNSSSSDYETGHIISNNILSKYYHYGIAVLNANNPIISQNILENKVSTNTTGVGAIYVTNTLDAALIDANKIIKRNAGVGIYLSNVKGITSPIKVTNNFIYVVDTTTSTGVSGIAVENAGSNNILIANNSISIHNNQTSNAGIAIREGVGISILNNNIGSFKLAPAIRVEKVYSLAASNHNNIYSPTGIYANYVGTVYSDLASWVSGTNKDAASVSVNPGFNGTDLHTCVIELDNAGLVLADVTDDIDGDVRNSSNDIGADQFLATPIGLLVEDSYLICPNENVTIGNSAIDGVTYSWSSGESTSDIIVSNAGDFVITATSACGSFSDTVQVALKPAAVADFSIVSSVGLAVALGNNSSNALAYSWDFGDGNTSTDFAPSHIYSQGGNYVIQLTAYGECDTVTSTQVYNAVALSSEELSIDGIKLYPNPATENINITFDAALSNATLKVFDVTGKVVYSALIESSVNTMVLPVSNLNTGVYTIQINSTDASHSLKFVKK